MLVLLLHGLGVYSLILWLLARLNPITFFTNIRPAMLFAFSTSSSSATLPVTLNVAEHRLGVDNLSPLYLAARRHYQHGWYGHYAGGRHSIYRPGLNVDIGLSGYLMVIATATLPRLVPLASQALALITLAMVLQQVGLPVEGIFCHHYWR